MPIRNTYGHNNFLSGTFKGYEDYDHGGQVHRIKAVPIESGFKSKIDKIRHTREVLHDPYRSRLEIKHRHNHYRPETCIQISPEEIDRQYKQAMEQMKRDQEAKTARETSLEVEASLSHGR